MTYIEFLDKYSQAQMALDCIFPEHIYSIEPIKKGMTNNSFIVTGESKKYVLRIPGNGANELTDRYGEEAVYKLLNGKDICDNVIYFNPQNGHRITEYWENSRPCNENNPRDVKSLMELLSKLHSMELVSDKDYDFFYYAQYYEDMRKSRASAYEDYNTVKANIFSLRKYVENDKKCLIHNDVSPDNCLFIKSEDGTEAPRLIDWEYSAMANPISEIAYFCVSCGYETDQSQKALEYYLGNKPDIEVIIRLYCYICVNALVQSNWVEAKYTYGEDYYDEGRKYYAMAKQYYNAVCELINPESDENV